MEIKNTLFGFKPIISISFSNEEIIRNIMHLYNIEKFDLDCTYSKGQFWKNLPKPIYKTDLYPHNNNVLKADSSNLPFENQSMKSVMFDPPFTIAGSTYKNNKMGSSIIAKRFESYNSFDELKNHYYNSIKEIYRILQSNGILVFKCQDVVASGKNHFSHVLIMNMALKIGFYPKDLFILIAKNRINAFNGSKWKKQIHARKYHAYFWVFLKSDCYVNYNF